MFLFLSIRSTFASELTYYLREPKNLTIGLTAGFSYKIELWGGDGGNGCYNGACKTPGGKGSYISGKINPNSNIKLLVIVGGRGGDGNSTRGTRATPGYNKGGYGGTDTTDDDAGGGGGGTSEILFYENNSRIMAAGGGSGGACNFSGAPGGDLNRYGFRNYSSFSLVSTSNFPKTDSSGEDGTNNSFCAGSGAGAGWIGGMAGSTYSSEEKAHMVVGYGGSCGYDERYIEILNYTDGENSPPIYKNGNGMFKITEISPGIIPTNCFTMINQAKKPSRVISIISILMRGGVTKKKWNKK